MDGALKPYLVLTDDAFEAGYRTGFACVDDRSNSYDPGTATLGYDEVPLSDSTQAIFASSTITRREFKAGVSFGYNEALSYYTDGSIVDGVVAYRAGYNSVYIDGVTNPYAYGAPDYDLWQDGSIDGGADSSIANMYTGDLTAWTGVDVLSVLGNPGAYSMSSLVDFLNAINVKTVNLPASPAAAGAAMTLTTGERAATGNALMALPYRTIPGSHTVSGNPLTLTFKQAMTLDSAELGGDLAQTVPVRSGTATQTYYLLGAAQIPANAVRIVTSHYDASGNMTSRTELINDVPSFPAIP